MKIIVLYLRILKKHDPTFPEHKSYSASSIRFLQTYRQFKPKIPHSLVVVNCGQAEHDGMFDGVANEYRTYSGGGFDCGTYQAVVPSLDCDLVMALNTHTYFWRPFWLEWFAIAAEKFGPGLYGATASFQHNYHLRTPSIAFHPKLMREYPMLIDDRDKAAHFESGEYNFSRWATGVGYPVMLVTEGAAYKQPYWRTPPNIFRRGNQSNCLIWDRHTDMYRDASEEEKRVFEQDADTAH